MKLRQFSAIILDTVREARSRRIFLGMAMGSSLCAALLLWQIQVFTRRTPHSTLTALSQSDPRFLDNVFLTHQVLASTASMALWTQVAMAIALLIGLLGPLLSAERNSLVLASPMPRGLLLAGRYAGMLAIALWGIAITFGEVWLAASWKLGVWHWPFLWGIPATLLAVAGALALLMLIHGAVDSAAVSIVLIAAVSLLGVGAQHPDRVRDMTGSALLADVAVFLGAVVPRSKEIADWISIYINSGMVMNAAPLWFTGLGAAMFLTAAGALFARREF
jgi:hypothetical protein